MTTLEQATGTDLGEFLDFDVDGNTMVFIEGGRLWKLDLATRHATWLMNKTEITGAVDFRADGVMFESASGLMFFDYAKNTLSSISDRINTNPYQINATFASAAKFDSGFTRWGSYVVYIGHMGLFAFDLAHDKIAPILLTSDVEARQMRDAEYRRDLVRPPHP